jgi:transposase
MGLRCKRCGSEEHVKNGLMRGQQRYLCKECGLNFTDTPPRGKPLALKAAAVLLYVSGLSMNRTAKLLGVSTPTVQVWLEQFAAAYAQKPEPEGRAVVIELDEMWHYLKKTRTAKPAGRPAGRERRGKRPDRVGSACAACGRADPSPGAGAERAKAPG